MKEGGRGRRGPGLRRNCLGKRFKSPGVVVGVDGESRGRFSIVSFGLTIGNFLGECSTESRLRTLKPKGGDGPDHSQSVTGI